MPHIRLTEHANPVIPAWFILSVAEVLVQTFIHAFFNCFLWYSWGLRRCRLASFSAWVAPHHLATC